VIMCFTAKKVTAFKKTVVLYPSASARSGCVRLPRRAGAGAESGEGTRLGNSELLKVWLETRGKEAEEGKRPDDDLVALNAALEGVVKSGKGATTMLVNVKQKKIKREVVVEKLDGAKAPLVQNAWAAVKSADPNC